MDEKINRRYIAVLFAGDLITIALITIFGFASHGTLTSAGMRVFSTFLPLMIGWLAAAPFIGAYKLELIIDPVQLWRPFWAMVIAAPLAACLRGIWLNAVIQPVFVIVLGGIAAITISVWRIMFYFWIRRARPSNG